MYYWLKNLLGSQLTDEQYEDIPYPMAELITHVFIKDIQAFGLLGSCMVGPITALRRRDTRNLVGIKNAFTKFGRNGAIIGAIAAPVIVYARVHNDAPEAIWDRCYRLRKNRGQVRVDQWSLLGATGGSALMYATGQGALFGALLGMHAGVLGAAWNNANQPARIQKSE